MGGILEHRQAQDPTRRDQGGEHVEHPQVWPDVHASFIVYLREYLRPLLGPRYIIAIETRVFVEGPATDHPIIPDASVRPTRPEASG